MIDSAQVGLAEAQQIKAAQKPNSSSAHPTQQEAQSTQKTSPMGEGWLSLLKWLSPLNLSKVGLFKGSDVVLSDCNLSGQHLHQGVPCLGCAYTIVTLEALTLCYPTTTCLGSTYIKVSCLGCVLATVTPVDVLIRVVFGSPRFLSINGGSKCMVTH
jgi:hypothetical protein